MDIQIGDKFTIENFYSSVKNQDRRWWQFWKPRLVRSKDLVEWKVAAVYPAEPKP